MDKDPKTRQETKSKGKMYGNYKEIYTQKRIRKIEDTRITRITRIK